MTETSPKLERALSDIQRRWVPDTRLGVFEVRVVDQRLSGLTTNRDAVTALRALATDFHLTCEVAVIPAVGTEPDAIVTVALAPLLRGPRVSEARVSDALHGERLTVLERNGDWLRVRAGDGYVAWIHAGYVATGTSEWADDWIGRATLHSLGAALEVNGEPVRLPHGARVAPRREGAIELADGRTAQLSGGLLRPEAELRAEARLVALPELALRWFGAAPYLWGGRSDWGVDCSGLVQSVYAARGIALPRDADQQYSAGRDVPRAGWSADYHAGDLLFFAEERRVSHVALWAGAGRIVHATLSRGGVVSEDLLGDSPRLQRLREQLVGVRRIT
jgi:hypothetical protein